MHMCRWGLSRVPNGTDGLAIREAIIQRLNRFQDANITVVAAAGPAPDIVGERGGFPPGSGGGGGALSNMLDASLVSALPIRLSASSPTNDTHAPTHAHAPTRTLPPPPRPPSAAACDNVIAAHDGVISVGSSDAWDQRTALSATNSSCIGMQQQCWLAVCPYLHAARWVLALCPGSSSQGPFVYR